MRGSSAIQLSEIRQQYAAPGLGERIEAAFRQAGLPLSSYEDLFVVDQLHIRGVEAVRDLAGLLGLPPGSRVLDLGCGLGGPARLMAAEFGWRVTGVDLCADFVQAARRLSRRVGLAKALHFLVADATRLPLTGSWARAVFSLHVQMNIQDKSAYLSRAAEQLVQGGKLVVYEIFAGPTQPVLYPTPWADVPQRSALCTPEAFLQLAEAAGLSCERWVEESARCLDWFQQRLAKRHPVPGPDLGLVMHTALEAKLRNVRQNLEEKRIRVFTGIFSRQKTELS
ncbi:MAG: class I SAM-dependent methyltransferase [Calditrichaeota bacterium]|nr:MAG: class I SAM-dependent methyltransferase [Calditrichota bacterium]